jgi:predicted Zn-dependent protease
VLLGVAGFFAWRSSQAVMLPDGISQEQYRDAERRLQKAYGDKPDRVQVLLLLGEEAVGKDQLETSLACFREIPTERPRYGLSARLQEAQVFVRLNRADDAEGSLRDYIARAGHDRTTPLEHFITAYKWLTYLLSVEVRIEDRKAELLDLHAAGLADVFDSKQLYFPHLLIWHSDTGRQPLVRFLEHDPENRQLRMALGRYQIYEGRLEEARACFEDLLGERPGDLRATAGLLECHFEAHDWAAFAAVAATLPELHENEPWLLMRMRAELALHEERWEDALRFFEQLQKVDAANPHAQMGLAKAYGELGQAERREAALRRSMVLSRIRVALHNVTESDAEAARKLAGDCDGIGFREAAETFRRQALRIEQRPPVQNSAPALQL